MNRFNRFLSTGQKPGEGSSSEGNSKSGGKAKTNESWSSVLREYESGFGETGKHRFQVCQRHAGLGG